MADPSKDELLARLSTIEEWKRDATEYFHDIEGWRDATPEQLSTREWDDRAGWRLYRLTQQLVTELGSLPHLPIEPIQHVCSAVRAWHDDRDAERVPDQLSFEALMDGVMMSLSSAEEMTLKALDESTAEQTETASDEKANGKGKRKGKGGTKPGEAQDKLRAALIAHHVYYEGGVETYAPVGSNDLAKTAGVGTGSASTFFAEEFGGHGKYKEQCADGGNLLAALKMLNGEMRPSILNLSLTGDPKDDE